MSTAATRPADCDGCRDAPHADCTRCEPFRVTGSPEAAAACFVRLSDLGWRLHTDQVEVAPEVWQVALERPRR